MPESPQENYPIITRMVLEDRQAINNLINHKRTEFKSVIKRGVIAMLNAHDERRKLAKERSKYFEFITKRNNKKKEKFSSLAETAKNATSSAPMGTGTAANILLTTAGSIGTAVYDNAEEHRQESEAQKELEAAQLLHYISSKNYEEIAQRVAEILSYRFQFLLFRLAAGEHGYFKLAYFFIESMNIYAVERLREHKGEEVKALVGAAIPSSKNAFNYRDWPTIDFDNVRVTLTAGNRKTLELDEKANVILKRCGPAVRAFLGGYKEHVDYKTTKIVPYKPYTILGALNHAPILNDNARVISGLKAKNRQYEGLSGTRKYPMILLSCDEETSDLGVTFGTTIAEILDDAHIETLRKLAPNFFSYKANYELTPHLINEQSYEIKTENTDLRYPNERYECPWTRAREIRWQERTQAIYTAEHLASETEQEEVITTEHYSKFKAMQAASNTFDADEARNAVVQMITEVRAAAQPARYTTEIKSEDRHKKQLETVTTVKYGALAAQDLMTCVITYGPSKDDYFTLTDTILEAGLSTLNTTRDLPLKESRLYQHALAASEAISTHANVAFSLHLFCQKNLQILLDTLRTSSGFNVESKFYHTEKERQSKQIKRLHKSIKDHSKQAAYHHELAKSFALTHEEPSSLELEDYLENVPNQFSHQGLSPLSALETQYKRRLKELNEALEHFYTLPNEDELDNETLACIIDLCDIETKQNHETIRIAFNHETCNFGPDDRASSILSASETLHKQATDSKKEKDNLVKNETFLQRHKLFGSTIRPALISQKNEALEARRESQALVKKIRLSQNDDLNATSNNQVNVFFEHIRTEASLARLRFDASQASLTKKQTPTTQNLKSQQQIIQALNNLNTKAQHARNAIKKLNEYHVDVFYQKIKRREDSVKRGSHVHQLEKQARKIRQSCEAIEKIITNDINLICFLEKKAIVDVTEIEEAKENINELKERLEHLQSEYFTSADVIALPITTILDSPPLSTASITSSPTVDRIDALIKNLTKDKLLACSPDTFEETLRSFIKNLESTPYLQAISPKDIQRKIVSTLQTIKEKIVACSDVETDYWKIELMVTMNLWLLESAQRNEVVYPVEFMIETDENSILAAQHIPTQSDEHFLSLSDVNLEKSADKPFVRKPSYQQLLTRAENMSHVTISSVDSDSTKHSTSSDATDITLATELTSANEALERIKKITHKKSPALRREIEDATKSWQEAYHAVYLTKNQLVENAQQNINPTIDKWNLVSSTLAWAGRLTNIELRWLNKKQSNHILTEPRHFITGKSPIRIAYAMMLAYSNENLELQKHTIGELNKFHRPLQAIQKQLCDLDILNHQGHDIDDAKLKLTKSLYQKLLPLVNEKIKQEEETKNNIDTLRNSVVAQAKRIHFNEWKKKMYKPEEQSERLQALRAGREKRLERHHLASKADSQVTSKPSLPKEKGNTLLRNRHRFHTNSISTLEEKVANFTIEDLEGMLENLQDKLADLTKPYVTSLKLNKSHSFYGGGFNTTPNSSSPESPKKIRTVDNTTLLFET